MPAASRSVPILLFLVTLLPYLTKMSGLIYLLGAIFLGLVFLYYAFALYRHQDNHRLPMQTFGYSIVYLMGLFSFLLVDHYIPVHL